MTAADLLSGDSAIVASFKAKRKDGVAGNVSLISVGTPDVGNTPGNTGGNVGGNSGGGSPVAIPLPPALWSGLASMGVMGLAIARRKWRLGQ